MVTFFARWAPVEKGSTMTQAFALAFAAADDGCDDDDDDDAKEEEGLLEGDEASPMNEFDRSRKDVRFFSSFCHELPDKPPFSHSVLSLIFVGDIGKSPLGPTDIDKGYRNERG